jgi:hypothetical protein
VTTRRESPQISERCFVEREARRLLPTGAHRGNVAKRGPLLPQCLARSIARAAIAAALTLLFTPAAHASPQARLVYGRSGAAVDSCPDETALRGAVAARIGYDPFFPTAPRTVIVTITPKGDRLVARVQLIDDDGHAQGARELASAQPDCQSLFDTVALTISIAIDPQALARPSPPPSTPAAPPPVDPVPPVPPPVAPLVIPPASDDATPPVKDDSGRTAPTPPKLRIGVALRGSLDLNPGPAGGASIYVGTAWTRFSIGLEAQADFPSTATATPPNGASTVTAWLVAGALVPCLRFAPIELCALAVVGRFDGTANGVTSAQDKAAPYVGLGGRIGVELPVSNRFALVAQVDAVGNVYRTTLDIGEGTFAWEASPVAGVLGLGALASF